MFDPALVTLGEVSSALRDFTVVGVIITTVWKGRGLYELVKGFFTRTTKHMDKMEHGMEVLLSNHLAHIEKDLRSMASRQVRASESQHAAYEVIDAEASEDTVTEA